MNHYQKISIALLRISIGWYFFWAGFTKALDPGWSAATFLGKADMLRGFYELFASPAILPLVNILNSWGLLLIGVALMLGISVRLASTCGALLMVLYYFPHANTHSYIVDEHIIYFFALAVLTHLDAGRIYGMKEWCTELDIVKKSVFLQKLVS